MNILICDNERAVVRQLERIIHRNYPFACVFSTHNKSEFDKAMELANHHVDILFLDISVGRENGVSLARAAAMNDPETRIVFVTAYAEAALGSMNVSRYVSVIKKPVDEFYVRLQIEKCMLRKNKEQETLAFSQGKTSFSVDVMKIIYLEGQKNNVIINLDDNRMRIIAKISDYENSSKKLVRCHQSFIVNLDYISTVGSTEIKLVTGQSLPVSRTYSKYVRDIFLRYKGGLI